MPNVTPLVGVLLVVFLSLVTVELRSFSVDVPRSLDSGCGELRDPNAGNHALRVALRADLSAGVRGAGFAADVEPSRLAPVVRHAVTAGADHDLEPTVIYVESDEEVRWGDLVSTLDTVRGVAPGAQIALVPHAEPVAEGWCDSDCEPTRSPVTAGDRKFDSREGNGGDTSLDTPMPRSVQAGVFAPLAHPRLKGSEESL